MGAGMIPPGADGSGGHLVDWDFHGAELGSSGGTTTAEESPGAVSGRKPQACLSWREGTFKSKEQEDTHGGAPAHWSSAPKAAVNLSVQKLCFIWEPRTGVGGVLLQVTKPCMPVPVPGMAPVTRTVTGGRLRELLDQVTTESTWHRSKALSLRGFGAGRHCEGKPSTCSTHRPQQSQEGLPCT